MRDRGPRVGERQRSVDQKWPMGYANDRLCFT